MSKDMNIPTHILVHTCVQRSTSISACECVYKRGIIAGCGEVDKCQNKFEGRHCQHCVNYCNQTNDSRTKQKQQRINKRKQWPTS